MRWCAGGLTSSRGLCPAAPRNPSAATSASNLESLRGCAASPLARLHSRTPPRSSLSSSLPRQPLRFASLAASAAAEDAMRPSSSRAASNETSSPTPPLAARPQLSSPASTALPSSSSSSPPATPAPRLLLRRQPLESWIDSIVSACDDAVGSRLSSALMHADAAALATQRRQAEERASERNYERYRRRFGGGGGGGGSKPNSYSAPSSPADADARRPRRREEEETEGACSSSNAE